MATLPAGRIELELDAAAPGQTAELAQQFVARHGTWMAIDQRRGKATPSIDRGCRP
jgi:hypothetical protein